MALIKALNEHLQVPGVREDDHLIEEIGISRMEDDIEKCLVHLMLAARRDLSK